MRNLVELIKVANHLYNRDKSVQDWINELEPLELAKLWHKTCVLSKENPYGAGYDDEVYEALKTLGYFE